MSEATVVPLDLLEASFRSLLTHLREVAGGVVELDKDAHWSVSSDAAYDVYSDPGPLGIGLLTDCLSSLERLHEDPSRILSYDLVHLGELLKAIGSTVVE